MLREEIILPISCVEILHEDLLKKKYYDNLIKLSAKRNLIGYQKA